MKITSRERSSCAESGKFAERSCCRPLGDHARWRTRRFGRFWPPHENRRLPMRAFLAAVALLLIGLGPHAEAADNRVDRISQTKTIKVAYRTDAAPFSFLQGNEPVGYTIDICKIVIASLERRLNIQGLKTEWVPVTAQSRLDAIVNGSADMERGKTR